MHEQGKFLKILQQAGDKGLTVEQIMNSMGHKSVDSVYSATHRLAKKGYKIKKVDGRLCLKSKPDVSIEASSVKRPYHRTKPPVTKFSLLLTALQNAGDQGMDKKSLAKAIKVRLCNLVYHVCMLRRQKCNVVCAGGRYYLKGEAPAGLTSTSKTPAKRESFSDLFPLTSGKNLAPDFPADIIDILLQMDVGQRMSYLEFLQKSVLYKKISEDVVSVNKQLTSIKKGVPCE